MMREVSSMIQTTRSIGTRYIQGYTDFLLPLKQAKYTFKKEMASEILRMMMDTEAFSNEMVRAHLHAHFTQGSILRISLWNFC